MEIKMDYFLPFLYEPKKEQNNLEQLQIELDPPHIEKYKNNEELPKIIIIQL